MATTYKILGQQAPAATTATDLYTVPAATQAVVSSVIVCNRSSSATATFRISASVAGASTANKDYIYYDLIIGQNDTFIATIGLTLGATDKIRIYASTANLSFTAVGSEIT
jgi:hypothetical protein